MTTISWTHNPATGGRGKTWNPVTGCSAISTGCLNCYAVKMTRRLARIESTRSKYAGLVSDVHFTGKVLCHEDVLQKPLKVRQPTTFFVNSMSDTFHEKVPFEFIYKMFAVMGLCTQHIFLLLTKRPHRAKECLTAKGVGYRISRAVTQIPLPPNLATAGAGTGRVEFRKTSGLCGVTDSGGDTSRACWPFPNVRLGVSVEDQASADERIPHLLRCPVAVRFLSVEPMLEAIDLSRWIGYNPVHEIKTSRRGRVRGGQDGPFGNPSGRIGMEAQVSSPQPMEQRHQDGADTAEASRRCGGGGISLDKSHDGQGADKLFGAPPGMAALQRSDSSREADKPHQRPESGQSSREPRVGNGIGKPKTRASNWPVEPKGHSEQPQQIIHDGCRGDPKRLRGGSSDAGSIGSRAQRDTSSNIKDRKGRSDESGTGRNSRLHLQQNTEKEEAKQAGSISWILIGGESGPKARPFDFEWAYDLIDQCQAANVPVFVKQIGSCARLQGEPYPRQHPDDRGKRDKMKFWPKGLQIQEYPK